MKIADCEICKEAKPILAKGLCKRCYNREQHRRLYGTGIKKWENQQLPPEERKAKKKHSRRNTILKNKYGIDSIVYDEMYLGQQGKCFICGAEHTTLDVDHDHVTGEVRWLLCRSCNTLLGRVEKDIDRIKKMLEILNERKPNAAV